MAHRRCCTLNGWSPCRHRRRCKGWGRHGLADSTIRPPCETRPWLAPRLRPGFPGCWQRRPFLPPEQRFAVPWSMTVTASAICCTPRFCSSLDALISPIRAVTRRMASTTSVIVAPALVDLRVSLVNLQGAGGDQLLISLAAVAVRCDKVRTSAATTAKPRPCSPARAVPPPHSAPGCWSGRQWSQSP